MLNKEQHLLLKMSEECAELSKTLHKAVLFGLEDRKTLDPTTVNRASNTPTNRQRIEQEWHDLLGVRKMLVDEGVLWPGQLPEWIENKEIKVRDYMEYARMVETLEPEEANQEPQDD